ncbi:MAG TPA: carotenoid biosynthesis protein [Bryobacteraceae bacterium]
MSRALAGVTWMLFAAVLYLILAGGLRHWVTLPSLGNIGFTLVFVLFAVVHCAACAGWKRMGLFFALTAVVSYLLEEIGVRTGWIYGPYHYSDMLGLKLGHVPVLIPLAWFMMIYPSWVVARAVLKGVEAHSVGGLAALALVAAMVMTAWDTVMDPGMAAAGNWTWEQGGEYFGVPFQNYFGWILTTFWIYMGAGLLLEKWAAKAKNSFAVMPVVVYGVYGLSYTTPRHIAELQLIAVFTMVMPALVALIQMVHDKE